MFFEHNVNGTYVLTVKWKFELSLFRTHEATAVNLTQIEFWRDSNNLIFPLGMTSIWSW